MCSSIRMASQKNISLKHTIWSWFFQEHFHYWWHPPPEFMYCVFFLHVLSPCGRGKLPTYMFFAPKPKSRNSWVSVFISTWHDPVLSCHGTLRRTSPLKCHHMDNPLIGWLSYHFHSLPNHKKEETRGHTEASIWKENWNNLREPAGIGFKKIVKVLAFRFAFLPPICWCSCLGTCGRHPPWMSQENWISLEIELSVLRQQPLS